MSIRGHITIKKNNCEDIYNYLDSYPTISGREIWDCVEELKENNGQIENFQGQKGFPLLILSSVTIVQYGLILRL